jgi:predicted NBD/HSP70 family sugar kinase
MASIGIDIGGTRVKSALVHDGITVATASSTAPYSRPDRATLLDSIHDAFVQLVQQPSAIDRGVHAIGVCAPGLFDESSGRFTTCVNLPGLVGLSLENLLAPTRLTHLPARLVTDAFAAATDFAAVTNSQHPRVLALSLGTGVGACVLDRRSPLLISGRSPGHFGQLDVSLDDQPPIGPDGGAGGLEAYIGLPALTRRFACAPDDLPTHLAALTPDSPPLRALARAIRIGHAIFRPDAVWLLGGIGAALAPSLPTLRALVSTHLTSVARDPWELAAATTTFHAAAGAARLAEEVR